MSDNNKQEEKDKMVKEDLVNFFENFLKPGTLIKEEEVIPGFLVKLKALSVEELLMSEALVTRNDGVAVSVVEKVKAASILSQAILSINGLTIDREDMNKDDNFMRRRELYHQILKMPPILVQRTYEFYLRTVNEQTRIYSRPEKISENTENFSTRPSET